MRTLAGVGVLALALVAQADPSPTALPTERIVLANGLTVVLAPDPDVATVAVHAWYATGSDADVHGRPALAARLAFRGSTHLGDGKHEALIDAAGGWTNATLAPDHTSCVALVPAGGLGLALQLEAERMFGLPDGFDARHVAEARTAIAAEAHARATELAIAQALDPARPGALGDSTAIAPADLAAFWRSHDDPAHATLVIAGRFEPAAARALVERDFGWIPRTPSPRTPSPSPRPSPSPSPRPLDQPIALALADDVPAPKLAIAFRTDRPYAPSTAAIAVAARLLGDGKQSRLYRALVDTEHLATDVRTELVPSRDGGRFTIEIVLTAHADPQAAHAIVLDELARLRRGAIDPAELARATAVLDTRFVEALENLAFRAETLARFEVWHGSIATYRASLHVDATALAAAASTWLAETAAVTALITPRAP